MGRMTRLMLMVVAVLLLLPAVSAHEQKEFTVILRDEGPELSGVGEGILFEGDYLFFRNHDLRDSARHRVLIDADGDGTFEGIDDIDTGWMDTSCETNETGHKLDEDCQAAALVHLSPEPGLLPGNISMMHQISSNSGISSRAFYVNYALDVHSPPTEELPTGSDEEHESGDGNGPLVLLLLASLIGISIILPRLMDSTEEK